MISNSWTSNYCRDSFKNLSRLRILVELEGQSYPRVIEQLDSDPSFAERLIRGWRAWGLIRGPGDREQGSITVLSGGQLLALEPDACEPEELCFLPLVIEDLGARIVLSAACRLMIEDFYRQVIWPDDWIDGHDLRNGRPVTLRQSLPPQYRHLLDRKMAVDLLLAAVTLYRNFLSGVNYWMEIQEDLAFRMIPEYFDQALTETNFFARFDFFYDTMETLEGFRHWEYEAGSLFYEQPVSHDGPQQQRFADWTGRYDLLAKPDGPLA